MGQFSLRYFMFSHWLMVACLLAPFSADALDAPADLVPAGLNVGDQFYVVFTVFDNPYPQATSADITTYNSYVQGIAAASTISGVRAISSGFQVIGATATANQCQPANLTKPVYNVNKTQVSSRASLMYDPAQPLGTPLNISQSGQVISNQEQAFTGCNSNGTTFAGSTLGDSLVGVGRTTQTDTDWISSGGQQVSINGNKSLYAISALLTVAHTPQKIPSLSEWSQILLGFLVITMIGWHFHKQRSY